MGGIELLILGIVFGSIGAWVWSLVDILKRSEHEWKALGQDRTLWLLVILFVGVLGSVGYLLAIRPKFERLRAMGGIPVVPMLGAVPPGWYPDPSGAPAMRWFDGRQWTPQTAAMGSVPMGGMPAQPQQGYGHPPQQGYGQPQPGYGHPPQQGYGHPQHPGYGQPGAPPPGSGYPHS
ncbi:MAG: DUF2510 domain-containing protein [Nannocystaceae bacterium]